MSHPVIEADDQGSYLAGPDAEEVLSYEEPRSDAIYIKVAIVLAVLTALEVAAYEMEWLGDFFLPVLFVLMIVKFILVVLFFMHLRWDAKIFSRLFWAGAVLAVAVYVVALATFQFFVS